MWMALIIDTITPDCSNCLYPEPTSMLLSSLSGINSIIFLCQWYLWLAKDLHGGKQNEGEISLAPKF